MIGRRLIWKFEATLQFWLIAIASRCLPKISWCRGQAFQIRFRLF